MNKAVSFQSTIMMSDRASRPSHRLLDYKLLQRSQHQPELNMYHRHDHMGQHFRSKGRGANSPLVQQRRFSYHRVELRSQFRRRHCHSNVHLRKRPRVCDEFREGNRQTNITADIQNSTCTWTDQNCHAVWSAQRNIQVNGYVRRSCNDPRSGKPWTPPSIHSSRTEDLGLLTSVGFRNQRSQLLAALRWLLYSRNAGLQFPSP